MGLIQCGNEGGLICLETGIGNVQRSVHDLSS
jgi:hypothetical protein